MDSPTKPAHCERCGLEWPWLERHHVIPQARGGKDGPTVWVCQNCHEDLQGPMGRQVADTPESRAKRSASFREWYYGDVTNREHRSACIAASWQRGEHERVSEASRAWHRDNPEANAARIHRISATKKGGDADRWSREHERCISCGQTDSKHASGGLCNRCYSRKRVEASHGSV